MAHKRINYDYLKFFLEIPLLLRASLLENKRDAKKSGRILLVNPCLVGEFIASLPALRGFLKQHPAKSVDLIVSPSVKSLAERLKGVDKVFVTKSVHARDLEQCSKQHSNILRDYDKIIILRISRDSLEVVKKLKAYETKTSFVPIIKYGIHLFKSNLRHKIPKQWRDLNFEILRIPKNNLKFEEIFKIGTAGSNLKKRFGLMKTNSNIVIIHTGASWSMNLWDNHKWAGLLKKMNRLGNFKFIFVGAKEEEKDYNFIQDKLNFKIYSLIGKTDIWDLLLILRKSNYFIGVDSGPRNMAHLADLRSVVLLGPGPHMYMPADFRDIVLNYSDGQGLYQRFFYSKNGFMKKISVEDVYNAFKKLQALPKK